MRSGQVLAGRYRLDRRLSTGGMSVVWCAHDEVLGRDVAVKMLSSELAADPHLLHRLQREARAAAGLRHPNIVEVYDYGETRDDDGPLQPYVVMELIDGPSLAQWQIDGGLPWPTAVAICAQVAAALAAAHARGVVHRDVKPGNVLVTAAGVKLVDFGISATAGEADETDGQVLGTPAYLAPERLDRAPVSAAADVYALGLLLYRTLTGHLPWPAATTKEMLTAHRYQDPAPLPPIPELPPAVTELCLRCLRKRPTDRPDAVDAARVLGEAAGIAPARLPVTNGHTGSALWPAVAAAGSAADFRQGRARVTAGGPPTTALESAGGRWGRQSPRRRAALVLAGAAVLALSGGVGVSRLGGQGGPQAIPVLAAPPAAAATAQPPKPNCSVRYALRRAVDGRFSAAVTVANTGSTPIRDWRLSFTFPTGQKLTRGWNATWKQTGRSVQALGGDLRAGGSASARFDGTYRNVTALPAQFQLNGIRCQTMLSAGGLTTRAATTARNYDDKRKKDDEDRDEEDKDGKHQDDD